MMFNHGKGRWSLVAAAAMAMAAATTPVAAWVSVGTSPGFGVCDYTSLQDAVDDGDNEIRVVNTQDLVENVLVPGSRTIRGGYTSCLSASLDLRGNEDSVIDGSGSDLLPVFLLLGISDVSLVLENLRLTGGASGIHTGGVSGVVTVDDSLIVANSGVDGGGITVGNPGNTLQFVIRDSSLLGNEASGDGGGIYCISPNAVIRLESGAIVENAANGDGGGVYLDNGCRFTSYAGTSVTDGSVLAGVVGNQAGGRGGGLFAGGGAQVAFNGALGLLGTVGNLDDPASLQNNQSGGGGGGVFATGVGTTVTFTDALVSGNTSGGPGGALSLADGVSATIGVSGSDCWGGHRCSVFQTNKALSGVRNGGHIHVASGAQLVMGQSHLVAGRADLGVAIYARDSGTSIQVEGSYLTGNGSSDDAVWSDDFVVRLFGGASGTLLHSTIAGNEVSTAALGVRGASSSLAVMNSLVFNPDFMCAMYAQEDASLVDECNIVNSPLSPFCEYGHTVGDPAFRVPGSDYRLSAVSPAIDRCADAGATLPDTDHQARGQDSSAWPDVDGPYDAGADEAVFGDSIFSDRFGS